MNETEKIYGINGPIISIKGTTRFQMNEMVYVGKDRLVGEVISLSRQLTSIEVYEDTSFLKPGDPVTGTGAPLSITLGPGILNNIFDGIERPLRTIAEKSGKYIEKGIAVDSLDGEKKWQVSLKIKAGDRVKGGWIFAACPETASIEHRAMIPPSVGNALVKTVKPDGFYTVNETLAVLTLEDGSDCELKLAQKWPIRVPRPSLRREPAAELMTTGQRVLDTLFPIARGGTAAIPGGFGTGKTMTQHAIAKCSDAHIIIYIGCGERGNEMTEVLEDFSRLEDPRTGNRLMMRTALIANTSNMPVAAREASIYTGITLAEYYRDMGYHVAIMADSTSRWAEALRELSGRMEEMPAEEGFPAYLASRISSFYERAGLVTTLGGHRGSVTIIGAVSPQGGDFSEPVTMNTKRFVRCFCALDKALAYERHYPAINWMISYSDYVSDLAGWFRQHVDPLFPDYRQQLMTILSTENKLMETVKLIGSDLLPEEQKLTLEIARVVRLGFLQQNSFHDIDRNVPLLKQFKMMEIILFLYRKCRELTAMGHPVSVLKKEGIFDDIIAMKYETPNEDLTVFNDFHARVEDFYAAVLQKNS